MYEALYPDLTRPPFILRSYTWLLGEGVGSTLLPQSVLPTFYVL